MNGTIMLAADCSHRLEVTVGSSRFSIVTDNVIVSKFGSANRTELPTSQPCFNLQHNAGISRNARSSNLESLATRREPVSNKRIGHVLSFGAHKFPSAVFLQ